MMMTNVSMMMNVSMNLKRFNCLDELARDNVYKRLDEGVVALLARLGPLERLHLDEFKRGNEYRRLKRLVGHKPSMNLTRAW